MEKHRTLGLIRLLIEVVLIICAAELLIMLIIPSLDIPDSGLMAALIDTLLLSLISTPLLLWRLRAHAATGLSGDTQLPTSAANATAIRRATFIAIGVFVLGSGSSLFTAYFMLQTVRQEADWRFAKEVERIEQNVQTRFDKPVLALKGLIGIHAAEQTFSRPKFRTYWQARGFQKDYPGVRGFGFIQHVDNAGLSRFLTAERHDYAPDFHIKRQSKLDDHYVITLIEPVEINREAVGLDISFETVRRSGAVQAARSGEPTLTGVITLVQDGRQGPGFLLLLPVYQPHADLGTEASRLAHLVGFVYSPLVAQELLQDTVPMMNGQTDFELYAAPQASAPTRVFASRKEASPQKEASRHKENHAPRFVATRALTIGGQAFSLEVHSTPEFEASINAGPALLVGSGGTLLSTLIALTLWLLAAGRARAEAHAQELTGDLQRLATVAERTSNSVIITDSSNHIIWVNQAFSRLSGYSLREARGRRASELRGEVQDKETLTAIYQALKKGENLRIETVNQSRDGQLYWVDLDLQTLRDERGQYVGYVAVERDITEAKQVQERERANAERLNAALRQAEALMSVINAHAIVSEADRDGRITHVNDAFCHISGYDRDELLGHDHRVVNSGMHGREFWVGMWQTISQGKPWRGQVCNRSKDGSLYWVDSIIAPFVDAERNIEKFVSISFDITQARQSQQDLAQERERLRNILEGTNVGTWEFNFVTGESRIDARWAAMLGYRLEELQPYTDAKYLSLVHPDDLLLSQTLLKKHAQGRSDFYEVERRMRHKDGHWVWVLARGRISSRLPDGRVEWMSGTHMDVSQNHILFEQLEKNYALTSAILENLPLGLSVFDAELNLVADNPQFRKVLQLPDLLFSGHVTRFEEIIAFNASRGDYGPGTVDELVPPIVERARHPVPHVFERTLPNGTTMEVRGGPMPGGGFITTYSDVSQRKQAESEAKRADEMLREAINTLDEAFVVYDPEDRLVLCNQRYKDLYKLSSEAIVPGNTFEQIIRFGAEHGQYKEALGRVDTWVAERLAAHHSANTDVVQELDDGRFLRIIERKTSDGSIVGFRIDATNLVRARMAAEEASRAKSQFLANMSHEIRTPMNAILGMLNLLQGTALNARQIDYVQKTEGAAKSLLELLNDILDFSKVEAGKMTLESAPFRIDHLMRDLSVILSANTGNKPVEVLFDIDPRLPVGLIGDSLRLRQVLINLGGNAIKFTQRGEVVIRLAVLDLKPGEVRVEFSVRDTGIGIAPENVARIFEGFSQAEASTTRRFGGTGLGLAISNRLVGMMDGTLELDSALGKGSTFHFAITLGVDESVVRVGERRGQDELRDLQVLIIDDNPVALEVLQAMVQPMGWQAEGVGSGDMALQAIRARRDAGLPQFDAVFVDWQMPGMDGWETSQQIRRMVSTGDSPIVLMVTAHGRELLARRPASEQSLLDGFLVKPVTASMVRDAIVDARLAAKGLARPASSAPAQSLRLLGMRVLLVEDNKINQEVAQALLSREGALVTLADNGQLGIEAIASAQQPYDVVLMDVQMPVMDGYTATRHVRETLGLPDLPIIAMTANAMDSDRRDAMVAGMNAHVGKPFNLDQLVGIMLEHSGYRVPVDTAADALAVPTQAVAAQAAKAQAASTLPGSDQAFDIQSALNRLGGNTTILARVLKSFGDDLAVQATELASHLAQDRHDEARRQMHTLKGTAATVGADRISVTAAEAENRLRRSEPLGEEDASAMVLALQTAVDEATHQLAPLLAQLQAQGALPDDTAPGAAVDQAALQADLHTLHVLLVNSDMASLEAYQSFTARHGSALGHDVDALDEAMAALDFAQGITLIESLQARYTP